MATKTAIDTQIEELQAKIAEHNKNIEAAQSDIAHISSDFMRKQMEETITKQQAEVVDFEARLARLEKVAARSNRNWKELYDRFPILETAHADTLKEGSKVKVEGNVKAQLLMGYATKHAGSIMLEGPTGSGKTTLVKAVGVQLNVPVVSITASGGMKEKDIIGEFLPTPDGKIQWVDGPLIQAMRAGVIFVIEEINMLAPAILAKLNGLLDANQSIMLPAGNDNKGELVKPSEGFFFAGTLNYGYEGTRTINRSFINRFDNVMIMDSMTPAAMITILKGLFKDMTDQQEATAKYIYASIQNVMHKEELDGVVSLRQMISFIRNWDIAEESSLINHTFKNKLDAIIDVSITEQVAAFDTDIRRAINRVKQGVADNTDKKTGKFDVDAKPLYDASVGKGVSKDAEDVMKKVAEKMGGK